MTDDVFPLDLDINPHPDLLEFGLHLRRVARANPGNLVAKSNHLIFLLTNVKATGWRPDDVAAWLERHEPTP